MGLGRPRDPSRVVHITPAGNTEHVCVAQRWRRSGGTGADLRVGFELLSQVAILHDDIILELSVGRQGMLFGLLPSSHQRTEVLPMGVVGDRYYHRLELHWVCDHIPGELLFVCDRSVLQF